MGCCVWGEGKNGGRTQIPSLRDTAGWRCGEGIPASSALRSPQPQAPPNPLRELRVFRGGTASEWKGPEWFRGGSLIPVTSAQSRLPFSLARDEIVLDKKPLKNCYLLG